MSDYVILYPLHSTREEADAQASAYAGILRRKNLHKIFGIGVKPKQTTEAGLGRGVETSFWCVTLARHDGQPVHVDAPVLSRLP